MSYIVKAGTPARRYFDPDITGSADPRGLYQWSAFYAPLTYIDAGRGTPPLTTLLAAGDEELGGNSVSLLLFTCDLPVIAQAYVRGVTTARYNVQAITNLLTLYPQFVSASPEFGDPVTVSNYGEVLKGYTAPIGPVDGVAVSGFPARLPDPVSRALTTSVAIVDGSGTVVPDSIDSLAVLCIANGGSVSGVIGPLFFSNNYDFPTDAPTPIILRSSQYTQAIKDNNNLVITQDGAQGQVVGLYYVDTPGPG
jgi:hypothetical protein